MNKVHANVTSNEETTGLFGERVVIFPWPVKDLTITNDSSTEELTFKFKTGHSWVTVLPGETIHKEVDIKQIILAGSGVVYRMWGLG